MSYKLYYIIISCIIIQESSPEMGPRQEEIRPLDFVNQFWIEAISDI